MVGTVKSNQLEHDALAFDLDSFQRLLRMIINQPIAERISAPRPDEIRAARERVGLTPDSAGALVSASKQPRRTWEKWEKEIGTDKHREMPQASWELFLLLTDQHPSLKLAEIG